MSIKLNGGRNGLLTKAIPQAHVYIRRDRPSLVRSLFYFKPKLPLTFIFNHQLHADVNVGSLTAHAMSDGKHVTDLHSAASDTNRWRYLCI